ncbi:MAG: Pr6Pr family membrane protein [Marmoricola sp.]
MSRARVFHLITFAVAAFAIVLQLVLVIDGYAVIDDRTRPDTGTALIRFCSYLTIWSNVLVAWSTLTLALGRDRDTPVWRALRLDAVVICFGGGIVHFFLLRPHLDHLFGWSIVADRLLHLVVPVLAMVGWLRFGPRGRAGSRDLGPFLVVPVGWLVYTLVRGPLVDWYPYPFIDVGVHGYPRVLSTCVAISVLMLGLAWLAVRLDRRLADPPAP